MIWTDNPDRDFARWDAEQAEWESKCPECEICGNGITEETLIEVDGFFFHEDCFMKENRIYLEDVLNR